MTRVSSILVVALGATTTATCTAATTNCTTLAQLQQRMPEWVGKVPYSHATNKKWGYPTDCSGFVSWALQTPHDLKAYEYASDYYSRRIEVDELQYGDVITHVFSDNSDKCKKHDVTDGSSSSSDRRDRDRDDFGAVSGEDDESDVELGSDYISGHGAYV